MSAQDTPERCPHERPAVIVPRPDLGPGWVAKLAPDSCPKCIAGQVLSTFRPGNWENEPGAEGSRESDAQAVEVPTVAPVTPEPTSAPERVEVGMSGKTAAELGELVMAWVAGFDLVARGIEAKAAANAGRLVEVFGRVAELERFGARARDVELLGERVAEVNGRIGTLAASARKTIDELAARVDEWTETAGAAESMANAGADVLARLDELGRRVDRLDPEAGPRRWRLPPKHGHADRMGAWAAGVIRGDERAAPYYVIVPTSAWAERMMRAAKDKASCFAWSSGDPRRRVIVESPYAGDVKANTAYARRVMLDSLARGEAPLLSHLLYTQVLDDLDPDQRAAGMEAGWSWLAGAEAVVVYEDQGVTKGMMRGIARAEREGVVVERRRLEMFASEYPAAFADLDASEDEDEDEDTNEWSDAT